MIKIIADDKIPFLKGALEPHASVRYMDGREIDQSVVKDADALLIRTRTVCNEKLLQGSKVRFIATATIGFDHVDTGYCDANSIRWTNAPGCNASSVQQYIASVLATLAVRHHFPIGGKTLGIIGVGHVGKKVETLARLLGMKVLLNDPPRARSEGGSGFVPLRKLLEESDIVTLHVPLNSRGEDKTLRLINASTLDLMKPGSWLINTSRGEVADGGALESALSEKKLGGAVLDVWENEPSVDRNLLGAVAIATPHIAGYSIEGKRNAAIQVVRSLGACFDLPVKGWEPSVIPGPDNLEILMDCRDHSPEELLYRAILHTYDVAEDDLRFRSDPGKYEMLRNNYHVRREFPAFEISMLNGNNREKELFENLGFQVICKEG